MNVRKPSFAGSWYPARASECEAEIRRFLSDPYTEIRTEDLPKANHLGGIVPHAGWYFSGSLACRVIAALRGPEQEHQPDIVVIFGMHLHPHSTPCIMTDGAWETPFGDIEIETQVSRILAQQFSFKIEAADRFTPDNTIELQLPFVKYFFGASRLIPIGAPPSSKTLEIANSLVDIAQEAGKTLKIIGSTDLTHYGDSYGFSPAGRGERAAIWARNHSDKKIIELMLAMNPEGVIAEGLQHQNACCSGAAAAAIVAARKLGATTAHYIGYSSSHDKHPGDSFVGYAGMTFS
ncbi:MAG: AmmeMemoRadiSam system protein B, partial [Desulfobacteraceae bacterium]